jgi:hypothetical protein
MSSVPSSDQMDPILQFFNERPAAKWDWKFDHSAAGESAVNALALGNLALLAYSGEKDMEQYLGNWGFDGGFQFLNAGATAGFAARITDPVTHISSVFISYRGTEPSMVANWLSDVEYNQTALKDFPGKVHGGFGRAFSLVRDQTTKAINALPGARLYLTGHSLGGALAVIAAAHFRQKVTAVYTYGQPRVGDQVFSDAFDRALGDRTFRYVNNYDIVPHLPPEKLPAPFPPFHFPHLPGGLLDLRERIASLVGSVEALFKGERFTDVGQLDLFIDGQPVSHNMADFRDRDPFDLALPSDPFDALRFIRERVTLASHADRGFIDHDPRTGYLPRLEQQLPPRTAG